jgi:hypothetical protein
MRGAHDEDLGTWTKNAHASDRRQEIFVTLLRIDVPDCANNEVVGNESKVSPTRLAVEGMDVERLWIDGRKEGEQAFSERVSAGMYAGYFLTSGHDGVRQAAHQRHEKSTNCHGRTGVEQLPNYGGVFKPPGDGTMRVYQPAKLNDIDCTLPNKRSHCTYLARKVSSQLEQWPRIECGARAVERDSHDIDSRTPESGHRIAWPLRKYNGHRKAAAF